MVGHPIEGTVSLMHFEWCQAFFVAVDKEVGAVKEETCDYILWKTEAEMQHLVRSRKTDRAETGDHIENNITVVFVQFKLDYAGTNLCFDNIGLRLALCDQALHFENLGAL